MLEFTSGVENSKEKYKVLFFVALFLLIGVVYYQMVQFNYKETEITFGDSDLDGDIFVDISGAVESPGVYKLSSSSRTVDLLASAGGISSKANADWVMKNLNLSQKLKDAQKIYVPFEWDASEGTQQGQRLVITQEEVLDDDASLINVNEASLSSLTGISGIGEVYAQRIIDFRPYADSNGLVLKAGLSENLVSKISGLITF